jgi:hypothetical protein
LFGAHGLNPEAIRKVIREIKGFTAASLQKRLGRTCGFLWKMKEPSHRQKSNFRFGRYPGIIVELNKRATSLDSRHDRQRRWPAEEFIQAI